MKFFLSMEEAVEISGMSENLIRSLEEDIIMISCGDVKIKKREFLEYVERYSLEQETV